MPGDGKTGRMVGDGDEMDEKAKSDDALVEAVAKALAGEEWEAKSFCETLSGDDPDEMRDYWRDKASVAIQAMRDFNAEAKAL